jgi:CPA2 family monovalent cation:H+ antiporter-2
VARGEFSIVIAGLAVAAQIEPRLGALATAYVLLLVIIGPLTARYAEPIAHGLARRLARPAVRSETLALDYSTRDPARTRARIGADQERRKQAKP